MVLFIFEQYYDLKSSTADTELLLVLCYVRNEDESTILLRSLYGEGTTREKRLLI